ncbi:uncharacterized protein LOC128236079 isoform X2 [Mya arenaria]|uniref:uncharacterized protein LOC128236079 isoform X2 n=1 Tax=Mya arenaria TaxID=6604 RepID=UPI0022E1358C|nr:uncharacterized protein LOC128236079 isoform X2 [Mya arenaria]
MAWIQFCLIAFLLPWVWQTLTSGSGMDGCRQNGQFFCPTAQKCIDKSLVCNGNNDCYYFEDERPPACDMDACRRNGHFFCNDSRQCILKSWVCDGYEDCKQGEDEAPPACDLDVCRQQDRYFCNDSRRCISKSRVCDGDEDCKQGEDEDPSACDLDVCRQQDRYFCNDSRRCISKSRVCNGRKNCDQYEDEDPSACAFKHCKSNWSFSEGCLGRCKSGYIGKYCQNCKERCLNGICNASSGICNDCLSGYYSKFCEKTCSKECLNGLCNRSSGICKDCTRTYLENCSLECGKGCLENDGFPQCDRQSGKCSHGCYPYQYGNYCNKTCRHCKTNSFNDSCDINGVCLFGCEKGYWDKNCNTKCNAKCQGDEHGNRCNSSTGECINGCTPGWSGRYCYCKVSLGLSSTDKENVNSLNAILIVVPAVATVVVIVVVVVGIICYLRARKRFNRQLNERMEPRRVLPVHIPPARQPSRSRRRASSYVYDEVNEETMEHYHYICEQNAPDHYDKIKDRKPCICPHCVRERVIPFLNRISSGSSSTTFVEPYAVGGGSISSRSYVSNSEINPRRSAPKYDHDGGIVPTKELTDDSNSKQSITKSDGKNELDSTDDSKPWRSVTRSDGALDHVGKTDNADGFNPGPCVAKSDSNIELVCTPGYLDLEALYQKAKAEDRRKLAAKYLDYGEDVFGEIGQFRAIEREECELPNNEIELQSMGQNIESSLSISGSELIEESCCSNNTDSILKQQPDEATRTQTNTERSNSDEIKQTDSVL